MNTVPCDINYSKAQYKVRTESLQSIVTQAGLSFQLFWVEISRSLKYGDTGISVTPPSRYFPNAAQQGSDCCDLTSLLFSSLPQPAEDPGNYDMIPQNLDFTKASHKWIVSLCDLAENKWVNTKTPTF